MDNRELLQGIVSAARAAGQIMLDAVGIDEATDAKAGHANFVTEYDRRVQELLFERLAVLLPQAHFVGEEEGAESFRDEYRKGCAFVIDPIDGTSNFIEGYRPSVISIALLLDQKPYIAVIFNPYGDMMFTAVRGEGAFLNGKSIHTSSKPLSESLVSFGTSPYYAELSDRSFATARRYMDLCIDLRRSGSAAWDLCQVAMGVTGMFFELRLSLWDYAAGALLVEEAGGKATDAGGRPFTYDGPSSVTAVSAGVLSGGTPYLPEDIGRM